VCRAFDSRQGHQENKGLSQMWLSPFWSVRASRQRTLIPAIVLQAKVGIRDSLIIPDTCVKHGHVHFCAPLGLQAATLSEWCGSCSEIRWRNQGNKRLLFLHVKKIDLTPFRLAAAFMIKADFGLCRSRHRTSTYNRHNSYNEPFRIPCDQTRPGHAPHRSTRQFRHSRSGPCRPIHIYH